MSKRVASDWSKPREATGLDVAFGGNVVGRLLPPMTEIPEEFKHRHHPWVEVVSRWFFSGSTKEGRAMTDRRAYFADRRRRNRARCRAQCRAWRAAHPGAAAAHSAVARALARGELWKPSRCEHCQDRGKPLKAHHYAGYEHPLLVVMICERCQRLVHNQYRRAS